MLHSLRTVVSGWRPSFCALLLVFAGSIAPSTSQAAEPVDFGREIQPILAKRCYHCHGPNDDKGGLRLNSREGALAETESGAHAVVPKDLAKSELIKRITSEDKEERMPPEGAPLTPNQVDLLKRWIEEGADWKQHWSFEPIRRPEAPQVKDQSWVKSPLDAFILAKLEAKGISPASPSEKREWIRRATFDVTGLPPSWSEVEAFVQDNSDQAYEKVVDRLLASDQYGERWARHWLDVVRYAETNSFERDNPKPHAWRYRDYVIRSFNSDKPYNQFLREQLAGDEFPEPTADSITATGFYRLGLWDDEPADRALARYDELDDIVSTIGQGMLGLTFGCARCHDHKIDPITQRDYYQLVAFMNNIRPNGGGGPNIETPIFPNGDRTAFEAGEKTRTAKRAELEEEARKLENQLLAKWEEEQQKKVAGQPGRDLEGLSYKLYRDSFDRLPAFGKLTPERTGALADGLIDIAPAGRKVDIGFVFEANLNVPADGEYTFYLDSDDGSRIRIDNRTVIEYDGIHGTGQEKQASIQLTKGRHTFLLEYFQRAHGLGLIAAWEGPGMARRALTKATSEMAGPNLVELFRQQGEQLLGKDVARQYAKLRKQINDIQTKAPAGEMALSVTENGKDSPPTFILTRGSPGAHAGEVQPAFPSILGGGAAKVATPTNAKSSGRRTALAEWIVAPENRLTARVIVNRIWQHHFGRGIVRSPNNFGGLGNAPTHPELLDYLATELVADGWKLKSLHKKILLSNTYRMGTRPADKALDADPRNDLFSRFDMRRLSAEEVRDTMLATSGMLNPKMYGPSIYVDIADEVKAGQSRPGAGWGKSSPDEEVRRSVYIHVKRSLITPLLSAFDFPETDASCEARFVTTQPAQALTLLNGKFANDQAKLLAARLAKEAGEDPAARIRLATRIALGREATASEIEKGQALLKRLMEKHKLAPDIAWKFYALSVLNLNEFVFVE